MKCQMRVTSCCRLILLDLWWDFSAWVQLTDVSSLNGLLMHVRRKRRNSLQSSDRTFVRHRQKCFGCTEAWWSIVFTIILIWKKVGKTWTELGVWPNCPPGQAPPTVHPILVWEDLQRRMSGNSLIQVCRAGLSLKLCKPRIKEWLWHNVI